MKLKTNCTKSKISGRSVGGVEKLEDRSITYTIEK